MKTTVGMLVILLVTISISVAGDKVVQANVCDILANPLAYDGTMVRVRGRVYSDFETFEMQGIKCGQSINALWLIYPDDPKVTPHASFSLRRGQNYKKFRHYLSAKYEPKKGKGICLSCNRYDVTATITGRLDGVEKARIVRDEFGKVNSVQRFGHLNRYRVRLVIQSICDVVAEEIKYPSETRNPD